MGALRVPITPSVLGTSLHLAGSGLCASHSTGPQKGDAT